MNSSPAAPIPIPRLLMPLGAAVILSLTGDQTMYASLATQTDVVHIGVAAVGVMLGVNRLVRIPGNPVGGWLVDRFGRRRPFIAGMALGTLSTALCAAAVGFWPLLLARVLWGTAWTLINVTAMTMVMDITTPADRGRTAGLYQISVLLGLSIMAVSGGALVDALGFRQTLLLGAGITGLGLLLAVFALPETAPAPLDQHGIGRRIGFPAVSPGRVWTALRRQITPAVLISIVLYALTNLAGNGVVMSTVGLLLRLRYGAAVQLGGRMIGVPTLAGLLLGIGPIMGIIAGPLAGWLSDRDGRRWRVMRWGLALGIVGFALLSLDGTVMLITAGVMAAAFADGILTPTTMAQTGDLSRRDRQGVLMGLYAAGGDLGSAAGPFLAYALAYLIELKWVYVLCLVLYFLALLATWGIGREKTAASQEIPSL
ncbi:MAG: MFS transporter [Anaerolineae bacterium]